MIGVEVGTKGFYEAIKSLKTKERLIGRATLNAIRRVVRRRITGVKKQIRTESGLGATVLGKDGSGLNKIVTLIRARYSGDFASVETGITLKGLAKLIEEGGRTKAHLIRPKNSAFLVFDAGGRTVFTKLVKHPGAAVRQHGFAQQAMDSIEPEIAREIDEALAKILKEEDADGVAA